MSNNDILVADIGGTNARLAMAGDGEQDLDHVENYSCADFRSAADLIGHYLSSDDRPSPQVMCLAAAGPVLNDSIQLTNSPWLIDAEEISAQFDSAQVFLLNDFDAIAYSLPLLGAQHCVQVGEPEPQALTGRDYTVAAVGPGTGLGTAALRNVGRARFSIGGEGGLTGFAAVSPEQVQIAGVLQSKIQRITSEHLVSGRGLENLYWALSQIHGKNAAQLSAEGIGEACLAGNDPIASAAMRVFFEVLGQYAGDVALMFGAIDGIFIAGGIAGRYRDLLLTSPFRRAFEMKEPHSELMRTIPTQLITHSQPGLLGAADYAKRNAG